MFRKLILVSALALASLTAACSNPFLKESAPSASVPAHAPAAKEAPAKVSTVVVQVPAQQAVAPAAAPSMAYPTLPAPAAAPNVTVNPAAVTVSVDAPKSATAFRVYGEYAVDLFNVLWTAFGATVLLMVRKALTKAPVIVQAGVAMAGGPEAIVQQMHDLAVNSIEGATKGKALDLNVGSKVLASVVQMGIDKGPDFLASVGGIEGLKEKFLTVAHLAEDVSAAKLGVSVPAVEAVEAAAALPTPANDAAPVAPVPAVA